MAFLQNGDLCFIKEQRGNCVKKRCTEVCTTMAGTGRALPVYLCFLLFSRVSLAGIGEYYILYNFFYVKANSRCLTASAENIFGCLRNLARGRTGSRSCPSRWLKETVCFKQTSVWSALNYNWFCTSSTRKRQLCSPQCTARSPPLQPSCHSLPPTSSLCPPSGRRRGS